MQLFILLIGVLLFIGLVLVHEWGHFIIARRNGQWLVPPAARIGDPVTACKHPRVRIVSRHEDTEYVECLECGDVFDSEEFHDMAIEESAENQVVEEENE